MPGNEQLIQQLYTNFNARNVDAILAVLAEDVAWANGIEGGHLHGREAIRAYWAKQWSMIDPHVEPTQITPGEDGSTSVDVHQTVRDLQGKLLLDENVQHVFRIENGHVSRFDIRSASQLSSVASAS